MWWWWWWRGGDNNSNEVTAFYIDIQIYKYVYIVILIIHLQDEYYFCCKLFTMETKPSLRWMLKASLHLKLLWVYLWLYLFWLWSPNLFYSNISNVSFVTVGTNQVEFGWYIWLSYIEVSFINSSSIFPWPLAMFIPLQVSGFKWSYWCHCFCCFLHWMETGF